jgi:hypothetical protein
MALGLKILGGGGHNMSQTRVDKGLIDRQKSGEGKPPSLLSIPVKILAIMPPYNNGIPIFEFIRKTLK